MRRVLRRRELVTDDVCYPGEASGPQARSVQPAPEFLAALSAGRPLPPVPRSWSAPRTRLNRWQRIWRG